MFFMKKKDKSCVCLRKGNECRNIYYNVISCLACFQSTIAHPDGDVLWDILQEGLLLQHHLVNRAVWHQSKERAKDGSLLPLPVNRPGLPSESSSIVPYAFNIYE